MRGRRRGGQCLGSIERTRRRRRLSLYFAAAACATVSLVDVGSSLASSSSGGQWSFGALSASQGRVVRRLTTANSVTYRLPNGRMLTRVFAGANSAATRSAASASPHPGRLQATSALANAELSGESSGENELTCTIDSSTPTTSECNTATMRAGFETTRLGRPVHGLVQFKLPNLQNNVIVLSAALELYESSSTTTNTVSMGAYRVYTRWGSGATWRTTNGSTAWQQEGGDFGETSGGEFGEKGHPERVKNTSVGASTGWHYWYPTQTVQKWLNGPLAPYGEGQPNVGFLIKDTEEYNVNNIVTFAGGSSTNRPVLTFEWVERGIGNATNYTLLPVASSKSTKVSVNAASGNLFVQATDASFASKGMPFNLARTTNSLAPFQFGYGDGWTDNNDPYVQVGSKNPVSQATYASEFGSEALFKHPGDVVRDKPGNLWVLDRNNYRIEEFNEEGKLQQTFGELGSAKGQLSNSDSLAVDAKGNVWVADRGNNRIDEFSSSGTFIKAFGWGVVNGNKEAEICTTTCQAGLAGSEPGQLKEAEGVAVNAHGYVWVSDTYNGRLEVFNEEGKYQKTVSSKGSEPGQVGEPQDIAIDAHNNVWVADWLDKRVEEFNEEGKFERQFGQAGTGNGQFGNPYGIAVDAAGDVWVADVTNSNVKEFNGKGEYLTKFGSLGTGPGQFSFSYPIGLTLDGTGDIWVTDPNNNRIEKWVASTKPTNESVIYTDSTGNSFVFTQATGLFDGANGPRGLEALMCEAGSRPPCPGTMPAGVTYEVMYLKTPIVIAFEGKTGINYPIYSEFGTEKATAHYTTGLTLPTSWTDSANHVIEYVESATEGYSKVTETAQGETLSYTEKADTVGTPKLVEVLNAHLEPTKYAYGSGAEEGLLTKITEPDGSVVKVSYDEANRVTKTERIASGQTSGPTTTYTYYELGHAPAPCTAAQKAMVTTGSNGNEEPTMIYCANVLDEVEQSSSVQTGQPGWFILEGETDSEIGQASVNLASGDLLVTSDDIAPEEANQHVSLNRFYNSQALRTPGTLGPGWSWGTGPQVYLVDQGGTVAVHGPSGYNVSLTRNSDGTYSPPAEFEGTLTKNGDATFTLTNEDNATYQFTSGGTLSSETTEEPDVEGNVLSVIDATVGAKPALEKLKAATGGTIEVKYTGSTVSQTVDPAGKNRYYKYNSAGQLISYTDPTGAKTEYGYDSNGYLNKIETPEAVEKITTIAGRVTEVSVTPAGGETTSERFVYQAPTSPCNPVTDAGETVVTQEPSSETATYCYDALGHFTGPKTESETELEGTGTPSEIPAGTCEEDPELQKEDCGLEEAPPETPEDLKRTNYAISDNNWLQERFVHHRHFDYLANANVEALKATKYRRVIPWNMVSEAERYEEKTSSNSGALALLEDVEEWIKLVKAAGAQPYVSFEDLCPGNGEWDDPRRLSPAEEEHDDYPCSQVPSKAQYKAAVERFLHPIAKHAILGEVQYFTALNEPNNQAKAGTEHEKPTYNNGMIAGEYWRALSDLCDVKTRATEKRPECFVAAGDFLDAAMPDAYNPSSNAKSGYPYFEEYIDGLGKQPKVYRWAWHAYQDGAQTQTTFRSRPQHWWGHFLNFQKAVDNFMKNSKHPQPEIWLTEQGVVYLQGSKTTATEAWQKRARAEGVLDAYLNRRREQLTKKSSQITRFFYYSTRGEANFDSGLLEEGEHELPSGLKPPFKFTASHPREIYPIYKAKTPG